MTSPEPSARPRIVDIAFWLWVAAAMLLFFNGVAGVVVSSGAVRSRRTDLTDEQVHNLVTYFRAWGVLCIAVAVAIAFLANGTRRGDKRFRRALLALSITSVLGAIVMTGMGSVGPLLLAVAVSLIVASVLIVRPTAQDWFDGAAQ